MLNTDRAPSDLLVERPTVTLRDQVVTRLREAIVTGHFAPGERLVERRMCELLGVSRTLVREALRQLEAEGWVRILPYRGPVVATFSPEEVRQFYELRAALEGMAAMRCAEKATPAQLHRMGACVDEMAAAQQRGDFHEHRRQIETFYDIMREAAGNDVLRAHLEALGTRLVWFRTLVLARPERASIAVREEQLLFAALKARDGATARRLCEEHLAAAADALVVALDALYARAAAEADA